MQYDNPNGLLLFDEKRTELTNMGFNPIPVAALKERYWINEYGVIVDSGISKDERPTVIYEKSMCDITSDVDISPLKLPYGDGLVLMATPAELYLLTYYGYLPAKTYRISVDAPTKLRYIYKYTISRESDGSLFLGSAEFRYSKLYGVYASKNGGCVFNGKYILSHYISKKGHHSVNIKNINGKGSSSVAVHRIVYDAWIGLKDRNNIIHHVDGYPWHNDLANLMELTPDEHQQIHSQIGRRNWRYPDDVIDRVCQLMSNEHGKLRPAEAARRVGIPAEAAVRYRAGMRPDISGKYTYPEHGQYRRIKLTDDEVHEICKLFVEGKLSNAQIGKQFGYSPETIRDIRERRTWRDLSSQYEFSSDNPTTRKSVKGIHHAATISEEDVVRIYDMLHRGIPPKEVSLLTGISYFIVKKIRYKVRWRELTDRLDAQYANGEKGSTTIETVAQEKDLGE